MSIGNYDAFEARRTGFEAEYFHNKDAVLIEKLRKVFQTRHDREELRRLTGITSEEVLDRLVAVQVKGEMLTAFKLLPLVEIAWADGKRDRREAEAVIAAAIEHGVSPESEALQRIREWLERGPNPEARKAWQMYAQELRKALSPEELKTFRDDLLHTAKQIAELSGGVLNMFFNLSHAEKAILQKITDELSDNPGSRAGAKHE
jgi:hypothetical protein